jgi:hypothetical protein
MVTLSELQTQVSARYDRLGAPAWPDPHPGRVAPRDEEYSRITEPERYRIVHLRARVWAEVLGAVPGIAVEPLAPAPLDDDGRLGRFDRGVRITSSRPGTLPLLLLERDAPLLNPDAVAPAPGAASTAGTEPGPRVISVLHISVAEPGVGIEMQPTCGCDACDSGSEDLLSAVDEAIGRVVGGPFVTLRGPGWHATWSPDGSSGGGLGRGPDYDQVMDQCRRLARGEDVRLPRGVRAYVGRPWFG